MKTIEKLSDLFDLIEKKEIKTNFVTRIIKNNPNLKKNLLEKSSDLDKIYNSPSDLQRIRYVFKENKIGLCKCGNPLLWRNYTKGYNKTCGDKKCSGEKNGESLKKHYMEKYGVEHLFKTEKFKENLKNTFIEKYGVDNPFKSNVIKDKIKETNLKKFGETSWIKIEENKAKIAEKISKNKREGRDLKIKELKIPIKVIESGLEGRVQIKCGDCKSESIFSSSYFNKKISIGKNPCLKCNPILRSTSLGEIELYEFIRDNSERNTIKNDRKILGGKEIDVYIPDLNLAFEFNGIYYHSEIFIEKEKTRLKKEALKEKGIDLINVWEDDWEYKKEIIKSRILNILGKNRKIYARKCLLRGISGKEEKNFLIENHIQGYVPSKIKIGLFYGEEMVSVMTFGDYRKSLGKNKIEGEYELLRFCNKLGISVIGGASKIFKEFISKYDPIKVISYQNNSWNTGNLYKNLGFKEIGLTDPNYYWAKGNVRFNRFNFRKDKLVKEGYDRNKTEWQIMEERGYFRIWDLGNLKWEYKKP